MQEKTNSKQGGNSIVEFLPSEAKLVLKTSENQFSQSEQILLTLFAQIIVEIIIKEEL